MVTPVGGPRSCVPATRLRLLRLHEIDRRVRCGSYPNAMVMSDVLEVSPRTIQRDIEFLRDSMGAPLEYDRVRHGYHYSEPSFALPALSVRESELDALAAARSYFGRLVASSLGDEAASLLEKLLGISDEESRRSPETLLCGPQAEVPREIYATIRRAVAGRLRLSIRHLGKSATLDRLVDPFDLIFYDGAWYLVGLCHLRDELRIFALSRIEAVETTGERCDPTPPDYDLEQLLSRSFSLFLAPTGAPIEQVSLIFSGYAARYVAERRWHQTQQIEDAGDGTVRLTLTLALTPALERWVLGWADEVLIESPPELIRRVSARHRRALRRQGEVGTAAQTEPPPILQQGFDFGLPSHKPGDGS